jgi:predicted membrane metal-binding protein
VQTHDLGIQRDQVLTIAGLSTINHFVLVLRPSVHENQYPLGFLNLGKIAKLPNQLIVEFRRFCFVHIFIIFFTLNPVKDSGAVRPTSGLRDVKDFA